MGWSGRLAAPLIFAMPYSAYAPAIVASTSPVNTPANELSCGSMKS